MSNYLKELRRKKRQNTEQVAKALKISQGYYSHIENGTRIPKPKILGQIAKYYSVSKKTLKKELGKYYPELDASTNWIWKIKIKKMPAIDAFKQQNFLLSRQLSKEDLIKTFIKFIEFNIGESIENELKRELNGHYYMEDFLLGKLRFQKQKDQIKNSLPKT